MLRYFNVILAMAFTLAGDALFSVAVIWQVLAQDGSAKTLGFFLCLVTILTYVMQKISKPFKVLLEVNPRKSFAIIRAFGVIFSIGLIPFFYSSHIAILYIAGMIFTVISFLSTLIVEAIMGQEVLQGRLSSNHASRILQTALQVAAFLGASVAGFILSKCNMKGILLVNAATYLSGALSFYILSRITSSNSISKKNENKSNIKIFVRNNNLVFWLALTGITLLALQISSFNFLVPFIAQHEKAWTATQFGLIDAFAGLGAFLCTFIMLEKGFMSKIWVFSSIGIIIGDSFFYLLSNPYLVALASFNLGFFVNTFRIKQREIIYDSAHNTDDILEWTGRITAMTTFVKSLTPLILAFFVSNASQNFMLCGIVIGTGIILVELGYYVIGLHRLKIVDLELQTSN